MNNENTPVNRNTGKMITKNLIILVVLVTVCSLSIWAWFTKNTKATADGISVMAKAEGVEVSWNNKDFYYHLTEVEDNQTSTDATDATGASDTSASSTAKPTTIDRIGPAKNLCDTDGNPAKLKLITGDGLSFFEPFLNRRTGEHILENGVWKGVEITESNSHGRYIDVELYFRSTQQRNVYLAKDSGAVCNDRDSEVKNTSEYGDFSKDNIGSAARVAFLDSTKKNVSFIWAPNADNELIESEDGYKKVTEHFTEKGASAGNTAIPNEMLMDQQSNVYYYLWLPVEYSSDSVTQFSKYFPILMEFRDYDSNGSKGLYACDYTLKIPTSTDNPSIPFFVTKSTTKVEDLTKLSYTYKDYSFINNGHSEKTKDKSDGTNYPEGNGYSNPYVAISEQEYYLDYNGTSYLCNMLYYSNLKAENVDVTIAVNTEDFVEGDNYTRAAIVVAYKGGGKTYNRAGYLNATNDINYYLINNNSKCALVNSGNSVAFSNSEHFLKSVHFKKDSNKQNVLSISVTLNELFTAIKDETDGTTYKATYKFQNAKTGEYLSVAGGNVDLNNIGSDFYLTYVADSLGPVLVSKDGYCLVFDGISMSAVEFNENIDQSTVVTVYTGTSYDFIEDSGLEKYYYYNETNFRKTQELTEITINNANVTPKLYTTIVNGDATKTVGPPIVELTKAKDTDSYFTGKIVMRIWVEGTDREAKTPLADGIFNLFLHFTYKK